MANEINRKNRAQFTTLLVAFYDTLAQMSCHIFPNNLAFKWPRLSRLWKCNTKTEEIEPSISSEFGLIDIQQKLTNTATFFRFAGRYHALPFTWIMSSNGKCHLVSLPEIRLVWWYIISFAVIPLDIYLWIDLYCQFSRYINLNQFVLLTLHVGYSFGWLLVSCLRVDYFLNRKSKVEAFNQLIKFVDGETRKLGFKKKLNFQHYRFLTNYRFRSRKCNRVDKILGNIRKTYALGNTNNFF